MSLSGDQGSTQALTTEVIKLRPYVHSQHMEIYINQAAWEDMKRSSLEVAVTHSKNMEFWKFASNECLYFASIDYHTEHRSPEPEASSSTAHENTPLLPMDQNIQELNPTIESQGSIPDLLQHPSEGYNSGVAVIPIGLVYLTPSLFSGELNVGISLFAPRRGSGYARMALSKVLKWVFKEAGYHRVQAAIMDGPDRYSAMNLFANAGFSHEGIRRRQVYNERSQQWVDVTYMAILDTDWTIRRYRSDLPKSRWDDLFERQQREREDLVELDTKSRTPRRTLSAETLKAYDSDAVASASAVDSESEMEERGEDIQAAIDRFAGRAIVDSESDVSEEEGNSGLWMMPRSKWKAMLSMKSRDLGRNTVEGRSGINNENENAPDSEIEENATLPPASESGSSFAGIDSDFDDGVSVSSWDRCSVTESA